MALKENGTVIAWGENTLGQTNVPAGLSNVMAIAAGWRHSVALKNDGTVVCWGSNNNGQTNVSSTSLPVKMIAAGGDHTLAAMYSPFVQYPVDVTKDLLLIYNTNSAASEWVKDYYLARRPMVSGANVLGVYYNTNEWPAYPGRGLTSDVNFTNQVLLPYLNWLNQNPTKRPQYIIWFYDLPVQVYTNLSPSYYLHTIAPGIKPFVTCINMRTTNDCKAYIDKLAAFGTNYSPGKLFISASKGGYGNTNYYFDDAGLFAFELTNAVTGVLENGNPTSSVHYTSGTYSQHFFTATNVAGYASWGQHGSFVPSFTTNGTVSFFGGSSWYLMMTIESYNGHRDNPSTGQSNFLDWYSQQAFGGANYENTPIGAVTHVDEPGPGWNNPRIYFGRWAAGRSFSDCAWNSRETAFFQAVGDPFVRK